MKRSTIRPILINFLVSYLIVLSLPLALCVVLYSQALGIAERETIASNMALLRQGRDIVDRMMDETRNEAVRLAGDPRLNLLLYADRETLEKEWFKAYDALKSVAGFSSASGDDSFFLYFAVPDIFITSVSVYKDRDFFLREVYGENFDVSAWRKKIGEGYFSGNVLPAASLAMNGVSRRYVAYLQSMPITSFTNKFFGLVVILIDEKKLHRPFESLPTENRGFFSLTDDQGAVITSFGASSALRSPTGSATASVGGVRMLVSSVRSEQNGWRYTVALPYGAVMEKVEVLRRWTLLFVAVIAAVSLMIAVYVSYRKSVPLLDLLKLVTERKAPASANRRRQKEYDWFERPLNELIQSSESIRRRLEEQAPLLRAAFFQKLIAGGYTTKEEIEAVAERSNVRFGAHPYSVLLFRIRRLGEYAETFDFDSLEKARAVLRDAVQSGVSSFDYVHDIDHEHILLLLEQTDDGRDDDVISVISGTIPGSLMSAVDVGIGSAYDAAAADRSYIEAVKALGYITRRVTEKKPAIMRYRDIPRFDTHTYYYPIDSETRVLNLIANGRTDELKKTVEEIREENFVRRNLSPVLMDTFLNELDATVLKASIALSGPDYRPSSEDISGRIGSADSYDDRFAGTASALLALCDSSAVRKRKGAPRIVERIEEYVAANYTEANLSLTAIADSFHMNESYLSFLFKEHSGENLSDRIERLRIEAAQRLLNQGMSNVNEIAFAVGYNGDQSFRRAFKRVTGMSPSGYRKQ